MQRNNPYFLSSILLFLLSAFTFSCKRKTTEITIIPDALKNHLQRARLLGNIKQIETNTYYFSDKDSCFLLLNKMVQFYSSDGFLTQAIVFNPNGDTISNRTVYYLPNAKENFWKEVNFSERSITTDTFLYDKNGFVCERQIFLNDSLLYKIQFKTDAIGGIIEMKRVLHDYHLTNLIYYNSKGLVERIEELTPDNKQYKFFTIDYDNYGDEVNRRAFKNANQLIEYTYTQYSSEGLLQKVIVEDRLHNLREDRLYTQHDNMKNWLEEIVLFGSDTTRKRIRSILYY